MTSKPKAAVERMAHDAREAHERLTVAWRTRNTRLFERAMSILEMVMTPTETIRALGPKREKGEDTRLLEWFLRGGKVWKSRNKGWFARSKGARCFGETHYGIEPKIAALAAMRQEKKR